MQNEPDPRPWEALEQIAQTGDGRALERLIDSLPAGEAARALSRLSNQEQQTVLTMLGAQRAAELLEECPEVQAADMLENLPPESAAAIMDQLPSDEQADLIGELGRDDAEAILARMRPREAAEMRELARYASHEAGGLMVTEFLAYPATMLAGDVLDDLRRHAQRYSEYKLQYVYCLSHSGELVGVLPLRDLLLTDSQRAVGDIMIRKPLAVKAHASLRDLEDIFERSAFLGVPVVDNGWKLLGVVRRVDVEEAAGQRAASDYRKSLGIIGGEELRTMPLRVRSARRLVWLSLNIVLNVVAASVIAFYQETLAQVIALAVFLPIISDMSGCAGNQAVAVSMRELTLGMIRPNELLRVWLKEVSIGIINGLVLGLLIAIVAHLWKGNAWLGLVVGTALAANTVIAVSIGGVIPLILKRLGKDPALASSPILTTITDMCGFFLVLSLASALLEKLPR